MLPVFARQSCVYKAFNFCKSASSVAVLFARATKEVFCASRVVEIATDSLSDVYLRKPRELTLWRVLHLLRSRGKLPFNLL